MIFRKNSNLYSFDAPPAQWFKKHEKISTCSFTMAKIVFDFNIYCDFCHKKRLVTKVTDSPLFPILYLPKITLKMNYYIIAFILFLGYPIAAQQSRLISKEEAISLALENNNSIKKTKSSKRAKQNEIKDIKTKQNKFGLSVQSFSKVSSSTS